jgi:hypothetical protein
VWKRTQENNMIERKDPSRIQVLGGSNADVRAYIESDFKIRSGLCPNGCGLLTENDYGQDCPACGFSCNTKAEGARNG